MKKSLLHLTLASVALAGALFTPTFAAETGPTLKADDSLARLVDGNRRFVAGTVSHPDQSVERRVQLAEGQHPFAIVLACADSRLSPEIIFDEGLGDLFVIRNAGNLLDDHVIASIEYAVEHLHVPLIVVLGHTKCGAVTAAVAGGELPGHLPSIAESLAPAVTMAKKKPGDAVDNAVRINARLAAAALTAMEPIIAETVKAGRVRVVAARYDIATGRVDFLE
jgi:carbonic anhydrase